jgi:indolepyruvate decarboxylase
MKESVGNFLFRRLEDAGVQHIFGVPGDYNLELMRQLENRGQPAWIGNCNELNASYAADGYARIKGLGALCVTNGVGALSAINGVAGAYSEHVPVVCVCGSIPIWAVQRGELMHHTLADRGKGNFYRAFAEVTTAQAQLCLENAAQEIDRLIVTAWQNKLPVYMEVPSDLGYLEIEVPEKPLELTMPPSDRERLQACTKLILERLKAAKTPAFLLDLDAERFGLAKQILELAQRFQMRVATLSTSKGAFPETSPLFAGMYSGIASRPETRKAVEQSGCLIAIGYRRVEVVSGFFTDKLPPTTIHLYSDHVDAGDENFQGVQLTELLDSLVRSSKSMPAKKAPVTAAARPRAAAGGASNGALTQDSYWHAMQSFLRPGDVILAEDGTSIVGAGGLRLPEDCTFISQPVWGSIGYTVGALLGALVAAPKRRHILFIGEGSFQLTAQELSTILRHGLEPYIFLINNHGYTIERAILGKDAKYNDVSNWRYADLPRVFHQDGKAESHVVEKLDDLKHVLDARHTGLVFVESVMDKYDAPIDVIKGAHAFANSDYGPRGPQSEPDAQIQLPSR